MSTPPKKRYVQRPMFKHPCILPPGCYPHFMCFWCTHSNTCIGVTILRHHRCRSSHFFRVLLVSPRSPKQADRPTLNPERLLDPKLKAVGPYNHKTPRVVAHFTPGKRGPRARFVLLIEKKTRRTREGRDKSRDGSSLVRVRVRCHSPRHQKAYYLQVHLQRYPFSPLSPRFVTHVFPHARCVGIQCFAR